MYDVELLLERLDFEDVDVGPVPERHPWESPVQYLQRIEAWVCEDVNLESGDSSGTIDFNDGYCPSNQ
jgi:hypothetical protein